MNYARNVGNAYGYAFYIFSRKIQFAKCTTRRTGLTVPLSRGRGGSVKKLRARDRNTHSCIRKIIRRLIILEFLSARSLVVGTFAALQIAESRSAANEIRGRMGKHVSMIRELSRAYHRRNMRMALVTTKSSYRQE